LGENQYLILELFLKLSVSTNNVLFSFIVIKHRKKEKKRKEYRGHLFFIFESLISSTALASLSVKGGGLGRVSHG
jgi:hypothetical protein